MLSESLQKNKYQPCEEIGRGRFGVISRVFCPMTQSSFACKTIDKRLLSDPTDRECLENEPKIMTLLSPHPNIVQIYDMFETDDTVQLILDLCQPVTLYDLILQPDLSRAQGRFLHAAARAGSCSLSQVRDRPTGTSNPITSFSIPGDFEDWRFRVPPLGWGNSVPSMG
ncbi:hypothetical protein V6N13_090582 [Hibiscus sabdariffa]